MTKFFSDPVWYGRCPNGWIMTRVKDIAEGIASGVWGDDPYDDESVTLVFRSNEIDENGNWRVTEPARRLLDDAERDKALLREGDLLLVKSSGSHIHIGKTAVVTKAIEELNSCFSNFTARVRFRNDCADSRFLWYYLNNTPGRDQLFFHGTTTTGLINLNATTIGIGKIALPPLSEQQQIVSYLDTSCEFINSAVAAKRKQIDALSGVRKSTLQRVVTRGIHQGPTLVDTRNSWLDQIPEGWSLVMLKRLAEIQSGLTLGKVYEDEDLVEYPYLRVANVQDGYVELEDVSTLEVPPTLAARVTLRAGDVLMTEGGDLDKLGRGTVWDGQIAPCLHQNHVFAVRCYRHKLLPHFLAYVTAAQYGRDYFEATGKRTTNLAATNSTKVGMFYIPLPPLEEQAELVRYLDTELGRLATIEANIGKQIETLLAYRKSLIHECVTGKRRITSADFSGKHVDGR